ncbi:MAG: lantibiotic dehydratase C-terminal domain-containing protein [Tumebacillaceae bacterium]
MWLSFRVNYHDPNKNPLLMDGVLPVVQSLQEQGVVGNFYFLRHWLRGPHLRLNLECAYGLFEQSIRPLVLEQIGAYLAAHPSATLSEEELLPQHRELAKMEMITDPLSPFSPNNTVEEVPYQNVSALGAEGTRLQELYNVSTSGLLVRLLERSQADPNALIPDLIQVMIAVIANVKDVRRSYLSFRSHSESMLHAYDQTGALRRQFQQKYDANREPIIALIRSMVQEVKTQDADVDPLFKQWAAFIRKFFQEVVAAVERGGVRPPLPEDMEGFYTEHGVPDGWVVQQLSEFHELFYSKEDINDILNGTEFKSLRMMLNYLYHTFLQAGIKPIERYYLGFLVANGVEDLYGVHWRTLLPVTE